MLLHPKLRTPGHETIIAAAGWFALMWGPQIVWGDLGGYGRGVWPGASLLEHR